jgi:hypothetical protein
MYFSNFLKPGHHQKETLFVGLWPSLECLGEDVYGRGPDDTFHFMLNLSRDEVRFASSFFSVGKRRGEVLGVSALGKQLDVLCGKELLHFLSSGIRNMVPVEQGTPPGTMSILF